MSSDSNPLAYLIAYKNNVVHLNKACLQLFGYDKLEQINDTSIFDNILHQICQKNTSIPGTPYSENIHKENTLSTIIFKSDESNLVVDVTIFDIPNSLYTALLITENNTLKSIDGYKQLAESLPKNEDHFRVIFERSASGIALVNLEGYLKITNSAVQKMLGYTSDELSNMIFTDFTHPDDANKNWELQQELVTGARDHYKMEKRCFRKNGEMFWGSVNVSAIRNDDGKVHSIIGVLEDITERKNIEDELEKSTAQFKAIFNSISDAAVFVGTNRHIIMINPAVNKQFGYNIDDLRGMSAEVLYANAEDYQFLGHSRFNVEANVNSQLYEMTYRRKDGSLFIGETQGTKVEDEHGNFIGFIGIIRDISERKKTEERLRLSQKIFEDTAKAILVTDTDNNIIDANDAFCETTGYQRKELIGQSPRILKSGVHNIEFYKKLWGSLIESGYWKGEIWDKKKNGEIFPTWSTISVVKDHLGNAVNYVAILSDITEIKQSEKRLEYLAHYDQLTKLPNRMLFNDRLSQAITRAERHKDSLAIMYIDLDGFKQVNDILGHTAGDELLKTVADRLKICVREEDTIARLGGDEFSIIINELHSIDFLHVLAKRITEELSISLNYEGREINVTGSIGVATFPSNGNDEETLLRHADQAMYYAKQLGRNTYQFFDPAIKADIIHRIHLGSDLRSAIKNDEFFMQFQPKYDLIKGKVVGVEALVRWQHPEHGIIQPIDFIPFSEDSDLIIPIGRKIIDLVCQHAQIWRTNGHEVLPIAINISARQFRYDSFVEYFQNILKETNVPASMLELEVTESLLMTDIENTISMLNELKSMGFKISIDDFGTGYSSLSYLKKLPVDTLKIDRSFVLDVSDNKDDKEIISTILSMAENLNLHVIAEGVENIEQLNFLSKNFCHEIQGNLIAEPVSFDELLPTIQSIEKQTLGFH